MTHIEILVSSSGVTSQVTELSETIFEISDETARVQFELEEAGPLVIFELEEV